MRGFLTSGVFPGSEFSRLLQRAALGLSVRSPLSMALVTGLPEYLEYVWVTNLAYHFAMSDGCDE